MPRLTLAVVCLVLLAVPAKAVFAQSSGANLDRTAADRAAVTRTGDAIRAGYAASDLDSILKYHHPDVEKWMSPTSRTVGRDALRAELAETFKSVQLVFAENHVESTLITGDTAVEVSAFTIRVTPKAGGTVESVKGRAMVVYVRSPQSPTGWLSMRELIQPAE
jgi:ketosteroid isomerase-like protein